MILGHYWVLVAKQQLSVASYNAAKVCKPHAADITMPIRLRTHLKIYVAVFM